MSHHLVAVLHQPIEQFGEANSGPGFPLATQRFTQSGVEPSSPWKVVAGPPQYQVTHLPKGFLPVVRQHRHQKADELPPVAQLRPCQVLKPLRQLRVRLAALRIFDDRHGGEQLQASFPERKGREMAFQRRLGVVGTAVDLRQWQRQALEQLLIGNGIEWHENARLGGRKRTSSSQSLR